MHQIIKFHLPPTSLLSVWDYFFGLFEFFGNRLRCAKFFLGLEKIKGAWRDGFSLLENRFSYKTTQYKTIPNQTPSLTSNHPFGSKRIITPKAFIRKFNLHQKKRKITPFSSLRWSKKYIYYFWMKYYKEKKLRNKLTPYTKRNRTMENPKNKNQLLYCNFHSLLPKKKMEIMKFL